MKFPLFLILLTGLVFLNSCKQESKSTAINYLSPKENGMQIGGVKMIPITTPKGTFNVWTKTIGNNPTTRLLLLNGGPGLTHEYFECFESFLPGKGIEIIH